MTTHLLHYTVNSIYGSDYNYSLEHTKQSTTVTHSFTLCDSIFDPCELQFVCYK